MEELKKGMSSLGYRVFSSGLDNLYTDKIMTVKMLGHSYKGNEGALNVGVI